MLFLIYSDIVQCRVYYHNLLKPIFLCFSINTKPRASANVILIKKAEFPTKDDKPTDVYHSFQEFCQRMPTLKLHAGWSINI